MEPNPYESPRSIEPRPVAWGKVAVVAIWIFNATSVGLAAWNGHGWFILAIASFLASGHLEAEQSNATSCRPDYSPGRPNGRDAAL